MAATDVPPFETGPFETALDDPQPSAAFETQRIAQGMAAAGRPADGPNPASISAAYDDRALRPLPRFDLVRAV